MSLFLVFEFCGSKFCLHLLIGRRPCSLHGLFWRCHGKSVMAFVPLSHPSTCGVSFHHNDGIMSFGVCLWSVFPPSCNDLLLVSFAVDLYNRRKDFAALNCLPLIMCGGEGFGDRMLPPTSLLHLSGISPNFSLSCFSITIADRHNLIQLSIVDIANLGKLYLLYGSQFLLAFNKYNYST